jgi:release factor glutamine methyltransferase
MHQGSDNRATRLNQQLRLASIPCFSHFPCSPFQLADLLPWAVHTLVQTGIERAGFEVQLLLAQALGVSRVAVITGSLPPPDEEQIVKFVRLIAKRAKRVPLAYLRGDQEFYGLPFRVSPAVLIPRPETEMLVDAAVRDYRRGQYVPERPFMVADIGTGSGCIAISILACCPAARAVGYDISRRAVAVARKNAAMNGVAARFRLVRSDRFTAAEHGGYDVIVSNPPYIPTGEILQLQPEVRDYEPRLALDGGPDGLGFYPGLASEARRALRPGGHLYVEVGQGQAQLVAEIFRAAGLNEVEVYPDLAGIERVVGGAKR